PWFCRSSIFKDSVDSNFNGAQRTMSSCGFPTSGKIAQPDDSSSALVLNTDAALQSFGSSERACSTLARAWVKSTFAGSALVRTIVQTILLRTKLPFAARPGPCAGKDGSGRASTLSASIAEGGLVNSRM